MLRADSTQKFDDLDLQIIRMLQEDSRKSYGKIADALNIAVGTVYNRVRRLEEEGILKGYTVIVDPVKLGYGLTGVILIQAEGQYLLEVEKDLAQLDDVICVYDITGDFDIAVIARFRSRSSLNKFIKGVLRIPHVTRTVTSVALDVVKEDFRVKV